jgi:LuxR family quorum sensing-dependent transcriptional regulator
MMFGQLEHQELVHLMELASRCLTATSPEQLEVIISSIYDLASYSKAALCSLSGTDTEVALAHYVNHSYGAQWAALYASQNFQRVDPILMHASNTDGVFRWGDVTTPASREGSASFLEAAEAFGLVNGVSFSCAGISPVFRSVLSLTGTPVDELERTRRVLNVIGPHLHESYSRVLRFHPQLKRETVELSAREREVLCWAQQGKTYWEIGCILGISQRTVKFHFARIKSKLDVVSTAHAIAKAMRMGLIT